MLYRIRQFRFAIMVAALLLLVGAWQAWSAHLNSSGRCTNGTTCEIGTTSTTSLVFTTDSTGDSEIIFPNNSIGEDELAPSSVNATTIASDSVIAGDVDDSMCTHFVAGFLNPTEAGATDDYLNLVDNTVGTTDAAEDDFIVAQNAKAIRLFVGGVTDPGAAGDIWKITVVENGTPTALTCSIGNGQTTCADITNEVAIPIFSELTVLVDSSTGSTDPDASGEMKIAFCLTPD